MKHLRLAAAGGKCVSRHPALDRAGEDFDVLRGEPLHGRGDEPAGRPSAPVVRRHGQTVEPALTLVMTGQNAAHELFTLEQAEESEHVQGELPLEGVARITPAGLIFEAGRALKRNEAVAIGRLLSGKGEPLQRGGQHSPKNFRKT